jgi:hypothetical protein
VWTDKNRAKYNRDHLRYPSDLTLAQIYTPMHLRLEGERDVCRWINGGATARATCPGRLQGVLRAGARDAVVKLADRCGALLSNTLPVRGIFDDHPFGLGTTGSYFTSLGREMYESADLVLGRHQPVLLRRWRALLGKGL